MGTLTCLDRAISWLPPGSAAAQRFPAAAGAGVAGTEEIKVDRKSESPPIDFGEEVKDWAEESAKQWPMHGEPSAPQVVAGKPQAVLQDLVQLQTKSHRVRARAGEMVTIPRIARNIIVGTGSQMRFDFIAVSLNDSADQSAAALKVSK